MPGIVLGVGDIGVNKKGNPCYNPPYVLMRTVEH